MREVDCQRPLRAPSAALALVLGGALTLHALPGAALGLGAQDVRSSLGQPLRLVIEVNAAPGETVEATCFKVHPLTVANDGLPQVTSAQLALERRNGQIRLVVTGTRPIADPVVRLSIDVGCETALRRDLTLLLDPPPAIEAPVEAAAGTPQPAPSRFPAPGPVTQNPDTQPSAQPAPRSTVVGPSVPAP